MRFVDWLFSYLSQILSDDLILSGSILEINQLMCLADDLYNILKFHILSDLLHVNG